MTDGFNGIGWAVRLLTISIAISLAIIGFGMGWRVAPTCDAPATAAGTKVLDTLECHVFGVGGAIAGALLTVVSIGILREAGRALTGTWFQKKYWRIRPRRERFRKVGDEYVYRSVIRPGDPWIPGRSILLLCAEDTYDGMRNYPITATIWLIVALGLVGGGAFVGAYIVRDGLIIGMVWFGVLGAMAGTWLLLIYKLSIHRILSSFEWGSRIIKREEAQGIFRTRREHLELAKTNMRLDD